MLAITNATVYPITSPPLSGGTVLLQEGKIKAVGEHLQIPSECSLAGCREEPCCPALSMPTAMLACGKRVWAGKVMMSTS